MPLTYRPQYILQKIFQNNEHFEADNEFNNMLLIIIKYQEDLLTSYLTFTPSNNQYRIDSTAVWDNPGGTWVVYSLQVFGIPTYLAILHQTWNEHPSRPQKPPWHLLLCCGIFWEHQVEEGWCHFISFSLYLSQLAYKHSSWLKNNTAPDYGLKCRSTQTIVWIPWPPFSFWCYEIS